MNSSLIRRSPLTFLRWFISLSLAASLSLTILGPATYAAPETITPGVLWYDTSSNLLSAHGGGIIKVGSTYYWIGEYKDNAHTMGSAMGHETAPFVANTCYSSTDFVHWTFVNNLLTQQASGDLGPNRVVERPKVIYNDSTGQYVMYMHIDSATYKDARVGVATSSTVCGNYTYLGSFKPLGNDSRDMTLYKDTDGVGYLISGDRLNIYRLTPDYLSVQSLVVAAGNTSSESPAMLKIGSTYYLFTSNKTWWASNDNFYYTASAIGGPWTNRGDFTPGSNNTWNSQTTFVQPIQGSSTTTYVFMGDRWCEGCFGDSVYVWLPLTINGTTVTMDWYAQWTIDVATGAWGVTSGGPTATSTNTPTGPTATATRTNTPAPPTNTPTSTNTPNGPTATPTQTSTPTATASGGTNLALNKPVMVSSSENSSTTGNKAVDGNVTTYWRNQKHSSTPSEWITVDLGSSTSVSSVVLKWNNNYATNYTLQVSPDNSNWTTVSTVTGENGGTDTLTFSSTSARYIKMDSTLWSNANERCWLNEFEIYP